MEVKGSVFISNTTVGQLIEFLSKFPNFCRVSTMNGNIVVDMDYVAV